MSKYDKVMMETVKIWAQESKCIRKKVGAVISNNDRVVSTGYNGTVSGADNCCEEEIGISLICGRCGCTEQEQLSFLTSGILENGCMKCNYTGFVKEVIETRSKNIVVHAEANAILFAAKNGIPTDGCKLYASLSPCPECAKMIIQCGIREVIYDNEYKDISGIKLLQENGIKIYKLKKEGE